MFARQVKHYEKKFNDMLNALNFETNFHPYMRSVSTWTDEELKDEFLKNSKEFQNLAYSYASTLIPGKVSCTAYAVVVSLIAKHYGVDYKVYSGYCMPASYSKFEEEMKIFNKRKDSGIEHPAVATHVFIKCAGICYEYYNGETSDIAHIDCVEICKN